MSVDQEAKRQQIIRGLAESYQNLFRFRSPAALSMYHGVDLATASRIWKREVDPAAVPAQFMSRINIGGRGSGKTVVAAHAILGLSVFCPGNLGVIVRKHHSELKTGIIGEFREQLEKWCDGHPEYLVDGPYDHQGYYEYVVKTGGKPSSIIIKPEPKDASDSEVAASFKGFQGGLGWAWADELDQLKKITWDTLRDSIRRAGFPWAHIGTTNPPYEGHWLDLLDKEVQADINNGVTPHTYIVRSSAEDNPFLPPGYVEGLKRKYKNDRVRLNMLVYGLTGFEIKGQPVFGPHFVEERHADNDLKFNPFRPLFVGLDFGRRAPAAVFAQRDDVGKYLILGELCPEDVTADQFATMIWDYINRWFPGVIDVEFWGDPAGAQKTDKGDTTIEILAGNGIIVNSSFKSRSFKAFRDLVIDKLSRDFKGTPLLRLRGDRCPILKRAFAFAYHYPKHGDTTRDEPAKDNVHDNPMDALKYFITNVDGGLSGVRSKALAKDSRLPDEAGGVEESEVARTY